MSPIRVPKGVIALQPWEAAVIFNLARFGMQTASRTAAPDPAWVRVLHAFGEEVGALEADLAEPDVSVAGRPSPDTVGPSALVTAESIAELRGVTTRTVVRWINDGRFPGAAKVNGVWLIPADELEPAEDSAA